MCVCVCVCVCECVCVCVCVRVISYLQPTRAATHRLHTTCVHFWSVDAVMHGAYHVAWACLAGINVRWHIPSRWALLT